MSDHYPSHVSCKDPLEKLSDDKGVSRARSLPCQQITLKSFACLIGGLALVALSATINVRAVTAKLSDGVEVYTEGGLALAVTVGFVMLPSFVAAAFRDREWAKAVAFAAVALLCGALSLSNIAGSSFGHRLATTANAKDTAANRATAARQVEKAEAEINALGVTRPPGAIDADIAAKLASRLDLDGCEAKWLASPKARAVCIEVARLRSEKATADRRVELEAAIRETLDGVNRTRASDAIGNGPSIAIVALATKLGLRIESEAADLLKSIGTAFAVEMLAAVLFTIAGAPRPTQCPTAVPTPRLPSIQVADDGTSVGAVATTSRGGVPRTEGSQAPVTQPPMAVAGPEAIPVYHAPDDAAGAAVLAALSVRGGSVVASQRSMADMFGVSKSSVNRVLKQLEAAGQVRLLTNSRGTAVELIAARTAAA